METSPRLESKRGSAVGKALSLNPKGHGLYEDSIYSSDLFRCRCICVGIRRAVYLYLYAHAHVCVHVHTHVHVDVPVGAYLCMYMYMYRGIGTAMSIPDIGLLP